MQFYMLAFCKQLLIHLMLPQRHKKFKYLKFNGLKSKKKQFQSHTAETYPWQWDAN